MPMRKYRSRPTTCEAEQWFPGIRVEGVRFRKNDDGEDQPYVVTAAERVVDIDPGDYIIREPGDLTGHYAQRQVDFEKDWELYDRSA
jgi:hypothetical protein